MQKKIQKRASQQMFGPSYLVRALEGHKQQLQLQFFSISILNKKHFLMLAILCFHLKNNFWKQLCIKKAKISYLFASL